MPPNMMIAAAAITVMQKGKLWTVGQSHKMPFPATSMITMNDMVAESCQGAVHLLVLPKCDVKW